MVAPGELIYRVFLNEPFALPGMPEPAVPGVDGSRLLACLYWVRVAAAPAPVRLDREVAEALSVVLAEEARHGGEHTLRYWFAELIAPRVAAAIEAAADAGEMRQAGFGNEVHEVALAALRGEES